MFRCLIKWYLTRMEEYKKMIEDALKRVYEVARKTTLDFAPEVSARHENNIWLKREDQQPVFSYVALTTSWQVYQSMKDKKVLSLHLRVITRKVSPLPEIN